MDQQSARTERIFEYVAALTEEEFARLEPNRRHSIPVEGDLLGQVMEDSGQETFVIAEGDIEALACLCEDGTRCGWACRRIRRRLVCSCDCSNCV